MRVTQSLLYMHVGAQSEDTPGTQCTKDEGRNPVVEVANDRLEEECTAAGIPKGKNTCVFKSVVYPALANTVHKSLDGDMNQAPLQLRTPVWAGAQR